MRLLIPIIILLTSAICSCHSQKQVAELNTELHEASFVKSEQTSTLDSLVAVVHSSSNSLISDVTVTFFTPDSSTRITKAAPASIHIGSITHQSNSATDLSLISKYNSEKSADIESQYSTIEMSDIATETNALSPPSGIVTSLILALIAAVAVLSFILYRIRSKHR